MRPTGRELQLGLVQEPDLRLVASEHRSTVGRGQRSWVGLAGIQGHRGQRNILGITSPWGIGVLATVVLGILSGIVGGTGGIAGTRGRAIRRAL